MKSRPESERARTPAAKQELREKILREAVHLFAEEGYTSFTMRKLAARIGYTATTIYAYFDDKDALLAAVITSGYDKLAAALDVSRHAPPRRLQALGRAYLDFAFANPELYKLMFMLRPKALYDLSEEKVRTRLGSLDRVGDAARGLPRFASLGDAALRRAAELFWAELHGLASIALQVPLFDERWARENLDYLLERLAAAAPKKARR